MAKPVPIIFEKLWLSGEVFSDWKSGANPILKREARKYGKVQHSQSQVTDRQDHGADYLENYAKANGKQGSY